MSNSEMYKAAIESGTLPQYNQYMISKQLEKDDPDNRGAESTDIQKKHKRYIRNVFMKNIDIIISEMVYPQLRGGPIPASHKIQICIYKNGKVDVIQGITDPDRSGLVFRMTDDYNCGNYPEWSTLSYFELMLSKWYGEDEVSVSIDDDREKYFKNGWVDIKREDIFKVGVFQAVKRYLMPNIY